MVQKDIKQPLQETPRLAQKVLAPFKALQEWLKGYFAGQRVPYQGPLDVEGATVFQKQVWLTTRMIRYGERRSYGWVARAIGHPAASRAVGQALASNPICIVIPCHRVVASNSTLCGFRGGLALKASLLALEMGKLR